MKRVCCRVQDGSQDETSSNTLAGNPAAAAGGLPLLAYDVVYASLLAEQGLLREALAYVSAVQVGHDICSCCSHSPSACVTGTRLWGWQLALPA